MRKFKGLGFLIFLAVFAAASAVVMLLWNSVAVNVFDVGRLTFWYAAGLLVLAKLLLGGWHHGHNHFHKHHKRKFHKTGDNRQDRWKECCEPEEIREMHEKFHSMSGRERREYIRRHMGAMHGGMHGFNGNKDCGASRPASANGPGVDEPSSDSANGGNG